MSANTCHMSSENCYYGRCDCYESDCDCSGLREDILKLNRRIKSLSLINDILLIAYIPFAYFYLL